jgi:hypothetical protein
VVVTIYLMNLRRREICLNGLEICECNQDLSQQPDGKYQETKYKAFVTHLIEILWLNSYLESLLRLPVDKMQRSDVCLARRARQMGISAQYSTLLEI